MRKNKVPILVFSILLITSVVFLPSLNNNFTNWDDNDFVTQNKIIQDLSWENTKSIFTSSHNFNYYPLALLSYSLEYHFFKLNPRAYLTTNLILHLLNCLLVFWFILLLSENLFVSFATAILFAIHPLHVESVTWISDRRDVLYSLFFLAAIVSYLYYMKIKQRRYYYLSIALFTVSVLAKAMAITLPILLLLFNWMLGRKFCKTSLKDKIPFLIITILFGFITFLIRNSSGDIVPAHSFGLHYNLAITSYALLFYLFKMLVPTGLACFYPYTYGILELSDSIFFFSPFIIAALTTTFIFLSKYTKKIIFGILFFVISISVALPIIPSRTAFSIVTDRYFYIPSIGLFYLFGELFYWILYRKYKRTKTAKLFISICFTGIIIGLSFLTWQRTKVWKNSLTLWNDVINKYPQNYIPVAYFNRGMTYIEQKEYKKAFADLDKALMLYNKVSKKSLKYSQIYKEILLNSRGDADTYNLFGMEFANAGRNAEAFILFTLAIQTDLYYLPGYINLAVTYERLKLYKQAIECGEIIIKFVDPNSPDAHYNLSVAYYRDNQYDLAIKHLETATKLGFTPRPEFLKDIEQWKKRKTTKNETKK